MRPYHAASSCRNGPILWLHWVHAVPISLMVTVTALTVTAAAARLSTSSRMGPCGCNFSHSYGCGTCGYGQCQFAAIQLRPHEKKTHAVEHYDDFGIGCGNQTCSIFVPSVVAVVVLSLCQPVLERGVGPHVPPARAQPPARRHLHVPSRIPADLNNERNTF